MNLTASSATDCTRQPLLFQDLGSRQVVADFSGGTLSSDGGALLLRQVDRNLRSKTKWCLGKLPVSLPGCCPGLR
ncbi:MAG: hypothetical protein ABSG04_00370 [Verrucomicrobiota bacterium]